MRMELIIGTALFMCIIVGYACYEIGWNNGFIARSSDYKAACIFHDCCRRLIDRFGKNAEEIYESDTKEIENPGQYYWYY